MAAQEISSPSNNEKGKKSFFFFLRNEAQDCLAVAGAQITNAASFPVPGSINIAAEGPLKYYYLCITIQFERRGALLYGSDLKY